MIFSRIGLSFSFSLWKTRLSSSMANKLSNEEFQALLDKVPTVIIDKEGLVFKYILLTVGKADDPKFPTKTIVRGYSRCHFHGDIFEETEHELSKIKGAFTLDCPGGGRIKHQPKKLQIYGYSQGYGKADHTITQKLLKEQYPDYEVTWTDDGY